MLPASPLAAILQEAPAPDALTDPEAVRRALETVFGQPAFQRELERADARSHSIWQVLVYRLLDVWQRFRDWLSELHVSAPFLYWVLFTALVILLLVLVAHITWTFRRAFAVDLPAGDEPETGREKVQRYRELRQQANLLVVQGAWREAARLLLLALLALIEERKVLHLARGWTNREILQRLKLPPAERAALGAFRARVEDAWYGGHALEHAQLTELAACVDRCAQLLHDPGDGDKKHVEKKRAEENR